MWKKDEPAPARRRTSPPAAPSPSPAAPRHAEPPREPATIGASINLRGELSGEEDLFIQGRIEGMVSLPKHSVVIGKTGQIRADVRAKSIRVEGEVVGNLFGEEEVLVASSGRLQGNITSPRVTLENGCRFKGSIDMEGKAPREDGRPPGKEDRQEKGGRAQNELRPEPARA